MQAKFSLVILLAFLFLFSCGGGGNPVSDAIDTPSEDGDKGVSIDSVIHDFTENEIDEAENTESLSVEYSVFYENPNLQVVYSEVHLIPDSEIDTDSLDGPIYQGAGYKIGTISRNTDIENVLITFSYNWALNEVATRISHYSAEHGEVIALDDTFRDKVYLLVIGNTQTYNGLEFRDYTDYSIVELPLTMYAY